MYILIFDETLTLTILIIGKILQETKNICITCLQRRPNVFNVGPTLYKWVKEVTSDYQRKGVILGKVSNTP